MVDESMSIPAIWDFINSWFTPTVLFVFLNLMIGTIAVTSGLGTRKQDQQQTKDDTHHHLARAPSVLQRLRSINLPQYTFRSQGNPSSTQENPSSTITTTSSSQTNPSSTTTTTTTTTVTTKKTHTHHFDSHRPDDELVQVHEDVQFHTQEDQSHHFDSHQTHEDDQFHHIQEDQIHHFDSHQTHEHDQFDEEEPQNNLQLQLQLQLQPLEPDNHRQEQTPEMERGRSIDEVYSQLQTSHVARTVSDTMPAAGELPVKLAKKMKKSASAKSAFAHFEVTDIVESRRPATVRVSKTKPTIAEEEGSGDDEEVDAKADDFINKFKQQLKLQRLDSIIRYKEMVGRGNNGK